MMRISITSALASLVFVTTAPANGQSLKLTLLGTGRPDPVIDRFGPATLVEAGNHTLLVRLRTRCAHLHSDHTVGTPDLWLTGWIPGPFGRRNIPLQVLGPDGTTAMMSSWRDAYQWDLRVRRDGEGYPREAVR